MLLSPGRLNQETIVLSSDAFHFMGSVVFCRIASTFLFAFSNCCRFRSITCNSLCSLILVCSITLSCTLPSVRSTAPALKATPAVIRRQRLNVSILCAMMSSQFIHHCFCYAIIQVERVHNKFLTSYISV